MVDLHTKIKEQPSDVLETIAKSMEIRAGEPAMQAICARYMGSIPRSDRVRVLEVGCGNGAATSLIFTHVAPDELIGVDPADRFIEMASAKFADKSNVRFSVGGAEETRQADESFDLVIAHTVYSHLPDPRSALREAYRVLEPGGRLVIFDGDYATITVSLFDGDPLQAAVNVVLRNMVHDPYVMRRLPALVAQMGFEVETVDPHGYVQTTSPDYLLTLLSRGLTAGAVAGEMDEGLVEGFMREAKGRVEAGTFYGAIMFVSLTARKPV